MLLFNEYGNLIYFKQKIYLIKLFLIQNQPIYNTNHFLF